MARAPGLVVMVTTRRGSDRLPVVTRKERVARRVALQVVEEAGVAPSLELVVALADLFSGMCSRSVLERMARRGRDDKEVWHGSD